MGKLKNKNGSDPTRFEGQSQVLNLHFSESHSSISIPPVVYFKYPEFRGVIVCCAYRFSVFIPLKFQCFCELEGRWPCC